MIAGLSALTALGACGFAPIYGSDTKASAARGKISVAPIGGLMGFQLRKRLTERLGPAEAAAYSLSVSLSVTSQALAINAQNDITRYSLTGNARYNLTNQATGKAVISDNVRAFAAYSTTASPYATSIAEKDARERLANALADQMTLRISASAERWLA